MANDARETHLGDQAVAYSKETFDLFHGLYHVISIQTGKTGHELILECMKQMGPVVEEKLKGKSEKDVLATVLNLASLVFVGIDKGHGH